MNNLNDILQGRTEDEKQEIFRFARAELARSLDDEEGFAHFFWCIFDKELPKHAKEWVKSIYEAKSVRKGRVIEAFRGSAKTTIVTIGFTLFRIGHDPTKSNILIQVGDDTANTNTKAIADIIENNPGWKGVFPHIVPDYDLGWSANGYQIKDNSFDYSEWRRLNADRKDPTLLGFGYRSGSLIGKRPTGVLIIDDINDINNTSSQKENQATIGVLTSTIFPARTPTSWTIFIGTPWTPNDVLSYVKATGEFVSTKTAILADGGGSVWPERFTEQDIESQRRVSGSVEFARMYMLDLTAAAGAHLKREWLHKYPYDRIQSSWPCFMGVDYASASAGQINRDFFTIAIGRLIPGGGIVLIDGFRDRVSQGEAEQKLKALASMYNPSLIGIENIGKGEEFFGLMLRTSTLPIMPCHTGKRSKADRFEKQMAPLFEFSRVWVSDAQTPFLQAFEEEWMMFPNAEHDDTLDAVYWMLSIAQNNIMPVDYQDFSYKKKSSQSMFNFGRL
jgi:phage terminase large subunit-like protein